MKWKSVITTIAVTIITALFLLPFIADFKQHVRAADHAEAPAVAHDAGGDIADAYLFLDPNNSNNVVMIMTLHGFVAPQENVNLGYFDPEVKYRFELELTGDARMDDQIDVTFSPRTNTAVGQFATIELPGRGRFKAQATAPSLATNAPPPVLTTNEDGVVFFAGVTDDPFFFDIPAFNRFAKSVLDGAPNTTFFNRGRDSFAGYNIPSIVLSVPRALVEPRARGTNVNHTLGMAARTQRRTETLLTRGGIRSSGAFRNLDRMGVPAVNTVLIPFKDKDRYNAASTLDDAKLKFAPQILATLTALGTDTNYQSILASVAVAKGDILRLNLNVPNSGSGRGLPAGTVPDAFPNGRRPSDDVIDIVLALVANGVALGDNVDGNDLPFLAAFPFLAPPQQPRESGDDNTRN